MKKKLGLDQTAAWLIAVVAAGSLFSGLYLLTKKIAQNHAQVVDASAEEGDQHDAKHDEHASEHHEESDKHDEHGGEHHAGKGEHGEGGDGHKGDKDKGPKESVEEPASEHPASKHGEDHSSLDKPSWKYERGEERWGDDFALCESGQKQSPIDILSQGVVQKTVPLALQYKLGRVELTHDANLIRGKVRPGSSIKLNEERYELVEVELHVPSEHTFEGVPYDLELHLIHRNEIGESAYLAVFMSEGGSGQEKGSLQEFWRALPKVSEKSEDVKFDPSLFVQAKGDYYFYEGSTTTPPCKEGVKWVVFLSPIKIQSSVVDEVLALNSFSARSTQPLYGRKIWLNTRS